MEDCCCLNPTSQGLLVSTGFGTVSSLHRTSFLHLFHSFFQAISMAKHGHPDCQLAMVWGCISVCASIRERPGGQAQGCATEVVT